MSLLIIGGDSLISKSLQKELNSKYINYTTTSRRINKSLKVVSLDLLENPSRIHSKLLENHTVYFLSGITSTKLIKEDLNKFMHVNVKQTIKWLKFFEDSERVIVFPSTSLVYKKDIVNPSENGILKPQSEYADAKLMVEQYLNHSKSKQIIIRLSKIVSVRQPLFQSWINRMASNNSINSYDNAFISPIHLNDAARLIFRLGNLQLSGVWNLSGISNISFYDYAIKFADIFGYKSSLIIRSQSETKLLTPQVFPTLNTTKASAYLGYLPPNPIDTVLSMFKELSNE